MNSIDHDVIVLGGGISGLTTARCLHLAGVDVKLIEAGAAVGGCMRTEQRDGFLLEKGPFNVMVRDPSFEALIEDVADKVSVVPASRAAKKRYIYRHGSLMPVPTNPISLMTTPLLTTGARCRLLSGMFVGSRAPETEETLEQAATRRFGKETADTLVSAVISGVFAGDIRKLSLGACFPSVRNVDRRARSLIGHGLMTALRGRRDRKNKPRRRWRGLVSIDKGLGGLTSAIGDALGERRVSNCRVSEIQATDEGYELRCGGGAASVEVYRCRRLVLATQAEETGRLLQPVVPEITPIASSIHHASLVVLNLGYKADRIEHPLEGFGFLVPHNEPSFPLMGVLWADSVFPHHAPPGHRLLRIFIGGARTPEAVTWTDDKLLETARSSLRDLLGISGKPMLVDICRFSKAIPQYHLGHADRVARMQRIVATQPNLHLVGNYLGGVSLNDCVRVATAKADELVHGADTGGGPCANVQAARVPGSQTMQRCCVQQGLPHHVPSAMEMEQS